jgi:hypothetical protein
VLRPLEEPLVDEFVAEADLTFQSLGREPAFGGEFAELVREDRIDYVVDALWGCGIVEKEDAIQLVADYLQREGWVEFDDLMSEDPLYETILSSIDHAASEGLLEQPSKGHIRAYMPDAADYTIDDWRTALLSSLPGAPTTRRDAIRLAANWARENFGLDYARLRKDGRIWKGIKSAINSAIRSGDVNRLGRTEIASLDQTEDE